MEQFQKEKEELDRGCRECKRKVAECQRKLKELEVAEGGGQVELERLRAEAQQLRKEERSWEQKLEDMRKKEKNMPWNVDTLSKDGFSKVGHRQEHCGVRSDWLGAVQWWRLDMPVKTPGPTLSPHPRKLEKEF